MGRYYDGDIEGKFWFGIQSSCDGEFFGAKDITEENKEEDYHGGYVDYCIANSNIDSVLEGIYICKTLLDKNYKILTDFFEANNGYNEEMVIDYYERKHNIKISEEEIPYADPSTEVIEYLQKFAISLGVDISKTEDLVAEAFLYLSMKNAGDVDPLTKGDQFGAGFS